MSIVKQTNPSGRDSWAISFRYREPDGSPGRFRRRFPCPSTAKARETETRLIAAAARAGSAGILGELSRLGRSGHAPTLREFAPRFLETYCRTYNRPGVYAQRRIHLACHLLPALGDLRLDELTGEQVDSYRRFKIEAGLKPSTVQGHLRTLSKLFGCAREWRELGPDDGPKIHNPKGARLLEVGQNWLQVEEEQAVIDYLLALPMGHRLCRWRAPLIVALRTGLRQGELRALRYCDVLCLGDSWSLRVCRTAGERTHLFDAPKDGEPRTVPLSTLARDELARIGVGGSRERQAGGDCLDLIFPGKLPDRSMSRNAMNRGLRQVLDTVGVKRQVTWHGMRHTFGTRVARKSGELRTLQEMLGHSSITTTQIYVHVPTEAARRAVESLDDYSDARKAEVVLYSSLPQTRSKKRKSDPSAAGCPLVVVLPGDEEQGKGGQLPATIPLP